MGNAPVLAAQPDWRRMDFLSDLHLQPSDKATFDAWAHYMASPHCDAMFILGDLFEVWVGDDILSDPTHGMFWQQCADVIRRTSEQIPVFFMHGNRDFLVGQRLLSHAGLTVLADPTVLAVDTARWVKVEFLSHTMPGVGLSFAPEQFSMRVNPGAIVHTQYRVKNDSTQVFVGQAIPSVTPAVAAPYFEKIECFCFSEQTFQPGEERWMPVVFVVNPELRPDLGTITLSYTFFEAPKAKL